MVENDPLMLFLMRQAATIVKTNFDHTFRKAFLFPYPHLVYIYSCTLNNINWLNSIQINKTQHIKPHLAAGMFITNHNAGVFSE